MQSKILIFMKLTSMRFLNLPLCPSENVISPPKPKRVRFLNTILFWKLRNGKSKNKEFRPAFIANYLINTFNPSKKTFFNSSKNLFHSSKLSLKIPYYGTFMGKTLILYNHWKNSTNWSKGTINTLRKNNEIVF